MIWYAVFAFLSDISDEDFFSIVDKMFFPPQNIAFTDWDRLKDEATAIAGDIKQVTVQTNQPY